MIEPIRRVENVRDLLAVAIAPELGKWLQLHADESMAMVEGDNDPLPFTQAMVAVVLDMLTAYSCRQLAGFKDDGGQPRDPRVGRVLDS